MTMRLPCDPRDKWIRRKDENNNPYGVTLTCPVCGFEIEMANDICAMNYCPNCGSRMNLEDEKEDG